MKDHIPMKVRVHLGSALNGMAVRRRPLGFATVATLCGGLLAGCWSGPERPGILVSTAPPGASCTLSRLGQPIATAEPTPAIALVDPGDSEITILCRDCVLFE